MRLVSVQPDCNTGSSPADSQAPTSGQGNPESPENVHGTDPKTTCEGKDPGIPLPEEHPPVDGTARDTGDGGGAGQPDSSGVGDITAPERPVEDGCKKTNEHPSTGDLRSSAGESETSPTPSCSLLAQAGATSVVPAAQRESVDPRSVLSPLPSSADERIAEQRSPAARESSSPENPPPSTSPLPEGRGQQGGESQRKFLPLSSSGERSAAVSRSPSTRLLPSPPVFFLQREQAVAFPWNRVSPSPFDPTGRGSLQGYGGQDGLGQWPPVQGSQSPSSLSRVSTQQEQAFPGRATLEGGTNMTRSQQFAPFVYGPPRMAEPMPTLVSPPGLLSELPCDERALPMCGAPQWQIQPSQTMSQCRDDTTQFSQVSETAQRGSGGCLLGTSNEYCVMSGEGKAGLSPGVSLLSLKPPPPPPSPELYWSEDIQGIPQFPQPLTTSGYSQSNGLPQAPAPYELPNARMASPLRLSPSDLFWSPELVVPPDQGGYAHCTLDPPTRIPLQNCRVSSLPPLSSKIFCQKKLLEGYCPMSCPRGPNDDNSRNPSPTTEDTPRHRETSRGSKGECAARCSCPSCDREHVCCCSTKPSRRQEDRRDEAPDDRRRSPQEGRVKREGEKSRGRHSSGSPGESSSADEAASELQSSAKHPPSPDSGSSREEGLSEDERKNYHSSSDSVERQGDTARPSSFSEAKKSTKNRRRTAPSDGPPPPPPPPPSSSFCMLCGCHNGDMPTPRSAREPRSREALFPSPSTQKDHERNLLSSRGDNNRSDNKTSCSEADLKKKPRNEGSRSTTPTTAIPRTVLTPGIASEWFFLSSGAIPLVRCHSPQERFNAPKVGIGGYPIYPSEDDLIFRNGDLSDNEAGDNAAEGGEFFDAEEDEDTTITPRRGCFRETGGRGLSPPASSHIDAIAEGFDPLAFSSRVAAAAELSQHSLRDDHSRRESPRWRGGGARKGAAGGSSVTRSPRDHVGAGASISTSRSSGSHHTSSWVGESIHPQRPSPSPPVPYIPIRGSKIGLPRKSPLERETLSSLAARNRRLENQVSSTRRLHMHRIGQSVFPTELGRW